MDITTELDLNEKIISSESMDLSAFTNIITLRLFGNKYIISHLPPNLKYLREPTNATINGILPKSLYYVGCLFIEDKNIKIYMEENVPIIISYNSINYYNNTLTDIAKLNNYHCYLSNWTNCGTHKRYKFILKHVNYWKELLNNNLELREKWIIYLLCCKQLLPRFVLFEIFKLTIL